MLEGKIKDAASAEIQKKLKLLYLVILVIIFLLLSVIASHIGPFKEALSSVPDVYTALIITINIALVVFVLYSAGKLSSQVIHRIEDNNEKLSSVLDITRQIREEIYGDILLNEIMDCSLAVTKSEAGSIILVDGDTLAFKVVRGEKAQELAGKSIPKDTGIAGWVLKHGEPVIVSDVLTDERFSPSVDKSTGYQTNSVLCVPLNTKASTIGVIQLLNKKLGFYNERDLEVIAYLADQAAISIERAQFYEDQKNYEIHMTNILLAAIEQFIPEKTGHAGRVAKYANIIAKALGMPDAARRRLYFAGLLHDIGFLKIPPDTNYEKEHYLTHPSLGYDMLSPVSFYADIAPFILYHHQRYDGHGYPGHLKGEEIPLESRILAIAEAFDCMVSDRSYKVAVSFSMAISELQKNKGSQFDPELVALFVKNIKAPLE